MGVTIRSNKGDLSFSCGYGIFRNLRETVAKVMLKDKYNLYQEWLATNEYTSKEELHEKCWALYKVCGNKLYYFLTSSDIEGKGSIYLVRQLLFHLRHSDEDFSLCYGIEWNKERKRDFIDLLEYCDKLNCGFKWY